MRRRRGRTAICAAVAAVSMIVTACSSSGGSHNSSNSGSTDSTANSSSGNKATGTPLVIGYMNDSGGPNGYPAYDDGVTAAIGYINNELGGVQGHPLKLDKCTDDGTAADTQRCGQQMVADKPLLVTIGLVNNMASVYPLLSAAGIPVVGGTPVAQTDYTAKDAYFFEGGSLAVVPAMALLAHKILPNAKSVGIIGLDVPQGRAAVPLVTGPLTSFGIKSKTVFASPTTTDYLAPLSGLDPSKQDAIIVMTTQPGCNGVAQATKSQNLKIPVIAGAQCNDAKIIKQAGGAMTGWYVWSTAPDPTSDDPGAVKYRNAMAKYNPSGAVGTLSESTFGNVMTIYGLLNQIGASASSATISSTLNTTPGKSFYGADYKCGEAKNFPSVCNFGTRWWQILDVNGKLKDATGGQYLDSASVLGG